MNERIKELARKANMVEVEYHPGFPDIKYPANFEKFAEMIVKECIDIVEDEDTGDIYGKSARLAMIRIKQHFGVKE